MRKLRSQRWQLPSHEDTGLAMCASYGSATFQLWLLIFANADPGRQHVMFQVHESIHTRDLDWVHDSRLEPGPVRAVAATWKVNQQIVAFYLTLLCLEIKNQQTTTTKRQREKKHSSLELKGHFIPALSGGGWGVKNPFLRSHCKMSKLPLHFVPSATCICTMNES